MTHLLIDERPLVVRQMKCPTKRTDAGKIGADGNRTDYHALRRSAGQD